MHNSRRRHRDVNLHRTSPSPATSPPTSFRGIRLAVVSLTQTIIPAPSLIVQRPANLNSTLPIALFYCRLGCPNLLGYTASQFVTERSTLGYPYMSQHGMLCVMCRHRYEIVVLLLEYIRYRPTVFALV